MPGRPLVVLLGPLAEPEASQLPPGADVLAPVSSLALDRLAERGGGRFRILDIRALLAPRIEAIRDAFVSGMHYDNFSKVVIYLENMSSCDLDESLIAYLVEKNECGKDYLVYDSSDLVVNCTSRNYRVEVVSS